MPYYNEAQASYIAQSGVIPYRHKAGHLEILLVRNNRNSRWVVPKGLVEPDMTAAESAIEEAWEEAGLEGEISDTAVGFYTYEKWGGICRVEVYSFRVTYLHDHWPEDFRRRTWFTVNQAADKVRETELKSLILNLPDWI